MAKRKTHWAVRRKNKQARTAEEGGGNEIGGERKNERVDRRAGFSEAIHPGSYAAVRKAELAAKGETAAAATAPAEDATNADDKVIKRRYGIWLAFCGKNYSGMQMYVL